MDLIFVVYFSCPFLKIIYLNDVIMEFKYSKYFFKLTHKFVNIIQIMELIEFIFEKSILK